MAVKNRTIIVYGNPMDGISFVGPFEDEEIAASYAQTYRSIKNDTWWTVELEDVDQEWVNN